MARPGVVLLAFVARPLPGAELSGRQQMRRTTGTLATTLVLVATLSACGGDPEPRFQEEPSAAPSAASPSASAEPEAWEERTDDGAVAFVEHWIDEFNISVSTGDSTRLERLSQADCTTCSNFVGLTTQIYDAGGSVEGGGWAIASTSEPERSNGATLISINIDQEPQTIRESAGAKPDGYSGGRVDYLATIIWDQGAWSMAALDVIE